jgi:protocatechuate 4,5-dioxygenase beta chain
MAELVGCITTSHVPAIGRAIAGNLQGDPYWKPFFDGFPAIRDWLARVRPDVAVVVSNDHGLNFFLEPPRLSWRPVGLSQATVVT